MENFVRIKMLTEKLSAKNGECYFFTDRLNRRYFSGVDIADGYLIVCDEFVYFTDARYYSAAKKTLDKLGIIAKLYKSTADIRDYLRSRGITSAYMDFSRTTLAEYAEYKMLFNVIEDCAPRLSSFREIKSEEELKSIKKACKIAQRAVTDAFDFLTANITELEVKDFIEERYKSLGASGASFDTIVAFGKNSAVPHHETGKRRLKDGDVVLIDTGAKVDGYCSDITRTAFFGKPDKEFIKVYNAVLSANIKAEQGICAGISGKDADKIAREELKVFGYGEYFNHSLGHGVGLEIHESPRLSPSSETELKDGAVFTIEPGVYLDGKFGVRIEDTCVMQGGKAVRLFTDSKKLKIIKNKNF